MVLAYVSAIQDISLSPVLMSGAGTSMPGPGEERWTGEEEREKWESLVKQASYQVPRGPRILEQDPKTEAGM